MNERERYLETILFGNPDRIPLWPGGPRESTIERWREEGLDITDGAEFYPILYRELGIETDPARGRIDPGVSFKMIPTFEEKVIEHKDGHYIVQDWMGNIIEISDEYDYTYIRSPRDFVTRKWIKFPVENRQDWERMKDRYDPKHAERFPDDFNERCRKLADREYPLEIAVSGPFWQLREWVGFEPLCIMMIEQPDFIQDMIDFWSDFTSDILQRLLDNIVPDAIHISEDMAYKQKAMISPEMTQEFLLPVYSRWTEQIFASGCPVIDMDSDGFIGELIPIWIDAGINCCDPIEVAAGNDIVQFRKTFGKKMAYVGGIDKRAMAKGGKTMTEEVMRVVPPLLQDGGFIPGCDHGVPPDVSWQDFLEYARLVAELTGWL
jgi:uroporphyrinogen decarboxylase